MKFLPWLAALARQSRPLPEGFPAGRTQGQRRQEDCPQVSSPRTSGCRAYRNVYIGCRD